MANLRISALTASTTPLAGTEVLPIVQSSTTKQVSVANLTAGRAISALSVTSATVGATTSTALSLQADGATKATVATTGNLLLGSASEIDTSFRLQITGAGGSISSSVGTNATSFRFISANTTSQWSFGNNSPGIQNSGDYLAWNRLPNGGSWSEFLRLDSSGNLTNQAGNFVVGTSGKGIDFSATPGTGTSELLADYEEGTWTPGNSSMTVNSGSWAATGTYTKIGRTVFYSVVQTSGTVSAASGVGMINGFPFTPARPVSCTYSNSAGTLAGVGLLETNSVFYGATTFVSQTGLRFSGSYEV